MVVQISHMLNNHIHTLKDPVIHVQVWWIMGTPKQPSMHLKCQSFQTEKGRCYTEDEAHTGTVAKMTCLPPLSQPPAMPPESLQCHWKALHVSEAPTAPATMN